MEDDGYFDELFTLFRRSQTVSAPNSTLGPYKRFEKDYSKACELKKAPFFTYLAEKQWDQMDKESRAEYENLSKRDSQLYEKLLSMYNQITNLSKKKPDGYIVFLQEKGKDQSINISELWTSLQEDEKKQYEEKAQQNQKENIESLIEDYISEYKQYIDKQKEVPQQLEFIHKKEEENNELDQIDIIIGIKRINGKKEYLVRFKGKTGKDAKWFPKKKLRNVKEMVKEFEEAYFKESFKNDEPSSGFDSTPVQLHQNDNKVEKAEENPEVIEEDEDQVKFQQLENEYEKDNKKKRNTSQNQKSKKTEKKIADKQKKTIKPLVKIMKEEKIQRGKGQPRILRSSINDEEVKQVQKVEKKQSQSIDKLDTTQKRIKVQTSTSQEPKSKVSQREQKTSEKTSQKVPQKPTQNATQKVEQPSQSKLRSSKSHRIQQKISLAVEEQQPKKDSPKQQPKTKSKSQQKTKSQPPAQSSRQRQLRSKSTSVPEKIAKPVTKEPIRSQKPEPEQQKKQIVSEKKHPQVKEVNQKKQNSETSKKVQTRQVNKKGPNGNKKKAIDNQKAKNNKQKNENVKKTIQKKPIQKKTIKSKAKAPERKSSREQEKKIAPLPIKKKIVKSMNLRKRK